GVEFRRAGVRERHNGRSWFRRPLLPRDLGSGIGLAQEGSRAVRAPAMPLSGSRLRRAAVVAATVPLALACPKERAPLAPLFEVGASPAAVLIGVGDVSSCSNDYAAATAALLDTIDGVVALVGDAVAPSGAPADYANCYDATWGRHKARTYPTPGDLDYQTPGAAGYFGYFGSQLAQFGEQALDSARGCGAIARCLGRAS